MTKTASLAEAWAGPGTLCEMTSPTGFNLEGRSEPNRPRPLGHLARIRVLSAHRTQAALAEASGVSRRTIIAVEKGAEPRLDTAVKLAAALGQPVPVVFPELLDGEGSA